jgi:thiosulfate dehydrogenase
MRTAVIACAVIGIVTVAATLAVGHRTFGSQRATEEYGQQLMTQTPRYLGRFMGNRLACASCHIRAGAEPGELSLVSAVDRGVAAVKDRINNCMTSNLNGRHMPRDGEEMTAIVAWLQFLADQNAATGESERASHDPPAFQSPDRAADPAAGAQLFEKRCADCHGKDGGGLPASKNQADGYLFPPLWGPGSFTEGSDMHGVPTAARFIKAKMPLGRPDLSDDEAFDVAAFIESKARPHGPH